MAVERISKVRCVCDKCGGVFVSFGEEVLADPFEEEWLTEEAINAGWRMEDGELLCPNCKKEK